MSLFLVACDVCVASFILWKYFSILLRKARAQPLHLQFVVLVLFSIFFCRRTTLCKGVVETQ